MKTITNKLTVGKEHYGLDLYCTLNMDGKKVDRFRSRSFLGSFAYMLQSLMHGGRDIKLGLTGYSSSWGDGSSNNMNISSYDISDSDGSTPLRVTCGTTLLFRWFKGKDDPRANYVTIFGAPEHNGIYRGVYLGSSQVELYHLDGTPVDGSKGSAVGGKINPAVGFHNQSVTAHTSDEHWPHYSWQNWDILVGKSDRPVSVNDVYLWDRIMWGNEDGQLSHGAKSTSPIVTDKPTSRFTISKAFTNMGLEDVIIRELGITSQLGTGSNSSLGLGYTMVRDTLDSPLTIPTGRTLTIDYELVVRLTPDTQNTDIEGTNGGFLESFMQVIRSCTFRSFGNKVKMNLGSGSGIMNITNAPDHIPWMTGIRLGRDNQFVSMTDVTLQDGISHGTDDGELYHYATDVSSVEYDHEKNKAIFVISRIFQNRGSEPVEIREIGLFGNTDGNTSHNSTTHLNSAPELLARTALHPDDQFTIQPGEFKKVDYIVEVIA